MNKASLKGILLIVGSVISFSIMAGFVKSLPHINSSTTVFYRFAIGLGLLGALALFRIIKLQFVNYKFLFFRGLTGGLAVFILYLSIIKLGIGKASLYSYSYPIFSSILSIFILKDKMPFGKWVLIFIAFIGLVLLSMDFHSGIKIFSDFDLYEGLAILGAVFAGLSIVFVKKLHHTDNSYAIFFSQTIVGFWIFLIPSTTVNFNGNFHDGVILMVIGIVAMVGQLLMTEGYKYTSVSTGSSLHLIVPILNSVIGIIFFNEFFTIWEITGGSIIIICCLLIVTYNRILKPKKSVT